MERVTAELQAAIKNLKIADHMLNVTYPMVSDSRILMNVSEKIFLGLASGMAALLYLERANKRIPPFQDSFESKFNMFKMNCVDQYKISRNYLGFITDAREIIVAHEESPVEFSRKDCFVICSDSYSVKSISKALLKDHLLKAKVFIQDITNIISRDALFRRFQNGLYG